MPDVIDTIDMEILMHRNAHFGGSFDVMIEYYENDKVGMMPDFNIKTIKHLASLEQQGQEDLSKLYLPESAQEIIQESQNIYQKLRLAYENSQSENIAVSNLILSEKECPKEEMEEIINQGKSAVPALIHLINSDIFYNPLFPGYGRSPIFAAQCLARIQDPQAIPPLFEALGKDNFFTDEEIIKALASFGEHAQSFLIKRLIQEPISKDNESAAIALSGFPENDELADAAISILEKPSTYNKPLFASYLIFACSDITNPSLKKRFINISKNKNLTDSMKNELDIVIKHWGS